jgi:putative transposase
MAKTRLEQFGEDCIVHIIHRGTRGTEIVRDEKDKWHFLYALYFLNDRATDHNWKYDINLMRSELKVSSDLMRFEEIRRKVKKWRKRETYVDILAYDLMPNHFHLLIYVKEPKDVGQFMHRLSASLAMRFNTRYKTKGGLFESKYKVSVIENDLHLEVVLPYIIYKNPCELFRGGIKSAVKKPNEAFDFVSGYEFSSLGDLIKDRPQSAILAKKKLYKSFDIPKNPKEIKKWLTKYLEDRHEGKSEIDYSLE